MRRSSVPVSGVLFALTSAAAFALQGLFARLAYDAHATTTTVGFIRFSLTALIFWSYGAYRHWAGVFPLRLPARTTLSLIVLGAAGYFLGSLTYLGAVATIPVSLAGLLLYTYPAVATVLAVRLGRERVTRRLALGMGVALAGVAVTLGVPAVAHVHGSDPRGVCLVLLSAVIYACYIVGSSGTVRGIHTVLAMAYISSGAAASFGLLTAATRSFTPGMDPSGWAATAGMAVVSTVIAAGTFLAALRRLGPARAATASTVEPVFTIVFAAILLGERLTPYSAAGGALILLGVLLVIRERAPV